MHQQITRRAFVASLTVVALAAVTFAATGFGHNHANLPGPVCQICYIGHLPMLQPAEIVAPPPPMFVAWHSPSEALFPDLEPVYRSGPSRAPPA